MQLVVTVMGPVMAVIRGRRAVAAQRIRRPRGADRPDPGRPTGTPPASNRAGAVILVGIGLSLQCSPPGVLCGPIAGVNWQ